MAGKSKNVLDYHAKSIAGAKAIEGKRTEYRIESVPQLVLVVEASGNAAWYFNYQIKRGGTRKFRKYRIGSREGTALVDAADKARELRAAVEAGGDPFETRKVDESKLTFEELAEKFLTDKRDMADTTRRNYRYALQADAYPALGKITADSMVKGDVMAALRKIEKREAFSQSEHVRQIVASVYSWARGEDLTTADPTSGIARRAKKGTRTRTPTEDEVAALWKGTETDQLHLSDAMRYIMQLIILTGQRRAEVCGMRRAELYLDEESAPSEIRSLVPVWVIPGERVVRGRTIKGRTKNKQDQYVFLQPQTVEIIRQAITKCGDRTFVFPADTTRTKDQKAGRYGHISPDSVTVAFKRTREAVGIAVDSDDDQGNVSAHDFRRAISNFLKVRGYSTELRGAILSHKSQSVTEAHYSQNARMEGLIREAMCLWSDHVWQLAGKDSKVVDLATHRAAV